MKVFFVSIVLDGLPFITLHYPTFRQLPFPWEWHVVEGVAANEKCTQWCKQISPRLSEDGTTQYLNSLQFDSRVKIYQNPLWHGKVDMVNAAVRQMKEPGLLWQVDSDEIWTVQQIERMRRMFMQCKDRTEANFYCRYFVGPDIVTVGRDCYGNNRSYEWKRVWRFEPGMMFEKHEPPVLMQKKQAKPFTHEETAAAGLIFDHFAYCTEASVAFKQTYYGRTSGLYEKAVENWKRLQKNTIWPVKLKRFLPWVDDKVEAKRL